MDRERVWRYRGLVVQRFGRIRFGRIRFGLVVWSFWLWFGVLVAFCCFDFGRFGFGFWLSSLHVPSTSSTSITSDRSTS